MAQLPGSFTFAAVPARDDRVRQRSSRDRAAGAGLLGTASGLGIFALASRLLGLARDAGLAWLLGAGIEADMLVAAMRLPHAIRRLLAEGSLSMSLTAMFGRCAPGHEASFFRAIQVRAALALGLLTGLLLLLAPWLMELLAPGFSAAETDRASQLLRLCLPYIFTAGMAATAMACLHHFGHFRLAAASPLFFNMVFIAAIGLAWLGRGLALPILACAMVAGGMVQWLTQLSAARQLCARNGNTPPGFQAVPGLGRIFASLGAGLMGSAAFQLAALCAMSVASTLGAGHMASFYYAERLLELPVGVLVMSLGIASLPRLASHAAGRRWRCFYACLEQSMIWTLLLSVAAAAGIWALGPSLVELLLGHGSFDSAATARTWLCLAWLLPGLPALGVARGLLCAANTLGRYRATAAAAACASMVCLGVARLCAGVLAPEWRSLAPAAGLDAGICAQSLVLGLFLRRHRPVRLALGALGRWRLLLQTALGALAALLAARCCLDGVHSDISQLALAVGAGACAWAFSLLVMRNRELLRLAGSVLPRTLAGGWWRSPM